MNNDMNSRRAASAERILQSICSDCDLHARLGRSAR